MLGDAALQEEAAGVGLEHLKAKGILNMPMVAPMSGVPNLWGPGNCTVASASMMRAAGPLTVFPSNSSAPAR